METSSRASAQLLENCWHASKRYVGPPGQEHASSFLKAAPNELWEALDKSKEAHLLLRKIPAPKRGEVLRQIREALAAKVGPSACRL